MRGYLDLKVLFMAVSISAVSLFSVSSNSYAKSFSDLTTSGSHAEAVQYLNNQDAYDYKAGNKFNGGSAVTRGEVAQLLHTMFGDKLDKVREYNNEFKDLTSSTKGVNEITWAYEVGIFDGDTTGKFNPTAKLTRAQMSKILVNTFNLTTDKSVSFNDVNNKHWAYSYVSVLAANGITNGNGKGSYLPDNNVTLDQLSSFVYRVMKNFGEIEAVAPQTPENSTPVAEAGSLEEIKNALIKMYNSPEYQPAEVVIYSDKNYKDELADWVFLNADISSVVPGYTRYGRTLQVDVQETEKGYKHTLFIYNDREDEAVEKQWQAKMDSAAEYIKSNYTLNTDYDVVSAINDFVISNIEYAVRIPKDHPYLERRPNSNTCTGYTDVTAELLKRFGIKHRYMTGPNHAWNLVFVGGEWYHMDTTFNDTSRQNEKYLLMTASERLESVDSIDQDFKGTNVPFTMDMAKPY